MEYKRKSEYMELYNKNKKSIQMFLMLLILGVMSLCGCKEKEETNAKYKIFYINPEVTGLVESPYNMKVNSTEQAVKETLEKLKKGEDKVDVQPAIPKGVEILEYQMEDEKLILDFNKEYQKMDPVQEVLCRSAIIRTLTQIEGIDLIAFYVEGEPLKDKNGNIYGYLQAEDFVQNTGSSINSFQEGEFILYYANKKGDKLCKEKTTIRFNSNQAKEKVIVEHLMKGSMNLSYQSTIPKGTKLLGISIKDGICYINFDEGFKNMTPGVTPEVVIYSIVNSIIENGIVSRVQIAIDGESAIMFQESVDLHEALGRNLAIVEE